MLTSAEYRAAARELGLNIRRPVVQLFTVEPAKIQRARYIWRGDGPRPSEQIRQLPNAKIFAALDAGHHLIDDILEATEAYIDVLMPRLRYLRKLGQLENAVRADGDYWYRKGQMITQKFNVGDNVTWDSPFSNTGQKLVGEIIEIVPPGKLPKKDVAELRNRKKTRTRESYIVRGRRKGASGYVYFWPMETGLEAAP